MPISLTEVPTSASMDGGRIGFNNNIDELVTFVNQLEANLGNISPTVDALDVTFSAVGFAANNVEAALVELLNATPGVGPITAADVSYEATNVDASLDDIYDLIDSLVQGGGSGDVLGPASSVNGNIVIFSGVSGKILQDSGLSTSAFAPSSHTHSVANVTGLQSALDNKVNSNSIISSGTATKVTYDSKGLVTSGTSLIASDVPNLDATKVTTGVFPVVRGGTGLISYTAGNFIRASGLSSLEQRTPTQVRGDIGAAAVSHDHSAADINSGTLPTARGGTGISSYTSGNFLRATSSGLEQRTPTQVRSDIGAAATSHTHTTSQITNFPNIVSTQLVFYSTLNAWPVSRPNVDHVIATGPSAPSWLTAIDFFAQEA